MLGELGVDDVPMLAVAKGPDRNAGRERFFLPGRAPLALDPRTRSSTLCSGCATRRTGSRSRRIAASAAREVGRSVLDRVPGIGAKRKRALLSHFGSAARRGRRPVCSIWSGCRGSAGRWRKAIYDVFHEGGEPEVDPC